MSWCGSRVALRAGAFGGVWTAGAMRCDAAVARQDARRRRRRRYRRRSQAQSDTCSAIGCSAGGQWQVDVGGCGSNRFLEGLAFKLSSTMRGASFITRTPCGPEDSAVTCALPRTTTLEAPGDCCVRDKERLQSHALCLSDAHGHREQHGTPALSLYTLRQAAAILPSQHATPSAA
jgi:hypothetical protein